MCKRRGRNLKGWAGTMEEKKLFRRRGRTQRGRGKVEVNDREREVENSNANENSNVIYIKFQT